jgi:hypothetical protein
MPNPLTAPHPTPHTPHLPQRIDREVGPREMTVRQMLHHTALRSRQASISTQADGGGPITLPHGGDAAGSSRRRSEGDAPGSVVLDIRRTGKEAGKGPPWGLESVQSLSGDGDGGGGGPAAGQVVDPKDDMAQVQAVAALARALSRRSSSAGGGRTGSGGNGSGGNGSGGGRSPRASAGGGIDGGSPRGAGEQRP